MTSDGFSFGSFRFDAAQGLLFRDGEPVPLGRRAGLLLAALLRGRGAVIPRADLIDAAWPGEAIEESNLSVQIAQLRKRIGGDWIRTVERVGYSFVAETAPRSALAIRPSLALRGLADGDSFATSLAGELLADFIRFASLQMVAGGTPSDYVLDCRWHLPQATLAAHLVETDSGAILWAGRFTDLAGVARRIVSIVEDNIALAETARAARDGAPQTAAALYHRARALIRTSRPEDYAIANRLLEDALALESDNVAVLAALCETLHHRIGMGWPALSNDDTERCFDYALRGLAQPVHDGRALALFGIAIFRAGDEDWGHALMQRAAALNPLSLDAQVYAGTSAMHWGDIDEAEAHFRQGLDLAPQSPAQGFVMGGLARIRMMQGDFEDALAWARRALLANPNYGATHWTLVSANAQLGRGDEAGRMLARFRRIQPGVTVSGIRNGQATRSGRMASTLDGLELAGLPA